LVILVGVSLEPHKWGWWWRKISKMPATVKLLLPPSFSLPPLLSSSQERTPYSSLFIEKRSKGALVGVGRRSR